MRELPRPCQWLAFLGPTLLFVAAAAAAAHPAEPKERVAVLVPIVAEASWRDDAFLSAVPAAAVLGNGEPIVLAVNAAAPWRPELLDFLARFAPARLLWVGPEAPEPPESSEPAAANLPSLELLKAASAGEAAAALAQAAWPSAERVVLFDTKDRGSALSAAALAARLGEPLLPCRESTPAAETLAAVTRLGAKQALWIGEAPPPRIANLRVERLGGALGTIRWLIRHGHAVEYLAAVNPQEEVAGRNRHLSLAAPLLAAGRFGAVAPLPYATRWKVRFAAGEELAEAPSGAGPSSASFRRGEIALEGHTTPFLTGRDPADGRFWLQLDRDGNGRFVGPEEQPMYTGEDLELWGGTFTANLDAEEAARGQAVWLTSPTAREIRADLDRFRAAASGRPRFLCLVGWPDALPMAVIGHGQGIDTDLVSDLPFGQTDPDPFVELALARFIAEDLPSATLLACRGLARDDLPGGDFRDTFATAEWERVCQKPLEAAGLRFAGHHDGGAPIEAASPLAAAGLIVHGSHAAWTVLGATYAWDSKTLLAPALVESAGCSTASLDQDPEHRSVAARLLRNGAVAFAGNTRRGVAQQDLFRSEFWNALLAGASLGEAQRRAQNRVLVAVLEQGQTGGGLFYYQLYNHAVYGDPALELGLDRPGAERPVRVEQRGGRVTVIAPERWHRFAYAPLPEWGCAFPELYSWRGAGTAVECSWYGPEKRNEELLYVNLEVQTRLRATMVEPIGKVPAPLGWTGACFIDQHRDGSRSLFFRVRMIDFDMTTGEVRAQVDRLDFRLLSK